ncbi:Imidazole glycerol phosphate synthase subunit HisF [Buchnera aphidicola (Thelaxes suberi)]|uniref:imidazole glycerol phosphate synthase subunit HisF n=1 Tax=Buchnera aphidicola TaxID=9 RepID=UPI0034649A0A
MLAKRIIPCLDVKNGVVVKGVQFRNHIVVGDIINLSKKYVNDGADELVFYDITASSNNVLVDRKWIAKIAEYINIPFCVAGGIKSIDDVKSILSLGADKVSINSPAISDPFLISRIADCFGVQCIVVGIDSWYNNQTNKYNVFQYTGSEQKIIKKDIETIDWVKQVQKLGAGEVVLNVMNQDGVKKGYDLIQLKKLRQVCHIPLIASGGAGTMQDFYDVFNATNVDGALAATVFHKNIINIMNLKKFLFEKGIGVRLC